MRIGLLASACLLLLASASAASAVYTDSSVHGRGDAQASINAATAQVRSKAALIQYVSSNSNSPLRKLPPLVLQNFVDSVVFTPRGVGSYSYLGLSSHLSTTEVYQVLALIGAQHTISSIPGLKVASPAEALIVRPMSDVCEDPNSPMCQVNGGKAKTDYVCSIDWGTEYNCNFSFGDICASNCGK
ncbi:hypothetical protein K4L06_13700 [Lysobacter sp. BMK333-48F3]|uniref:hypothetical protein n=1 Tax=Lysobacter sp. BMK333-48F3 TaxID=2867962 RepID=UPI001C8BE843|nr:hypothetical protein [Lysobacter sp. BMK333-48F3]MBX9402364.1 hypothetical protein [Lysobacter sp. BMK333-48F3]